MNLYMFCAIFILDLLHCDSLRRGTKAQRKIAPVIFLYLYQWALSTVLQASPHRILSNSQPQQSTGCPPQTRSRLALPPECRACARNRSHRSCLQSACVCVWMQCRISARAGRVRSAAGVSASIPSTCCGFPTRRRTMRTPRPTQATTKTTTTRSKNPLRRTTLPRSLPDRLTAHRSLRVAVC